LGLRTGLQIHHLFDVVLTTISHYDDLAHIHQNTISGFRYKCIDLIGVLGIHRDSDIQRHAVCTIIFLQGRHHL